MISHLCVFIVRRHTGNRGLSILAILLFSYLRNVTPIHIGRREKSLLLYWRTVHIVINIVERFPRKYPLHWLKLCRDTVEDLLRMLLHRALENYILIVNCASHAKIINGMCDCIYYIIQLYYQLIILWRYYAHFRDHSLYYEKKHLKF